MQFPEDPESVNYPAPYATTEPMMPRYSYRVNVRCATSSRHYLEITGFFAIAVDKHSIYPIIRIDGFQS